MRMILPAVVFFVSVLCAAISVTLWAMTWSFMSDAVAAEGVVIELIEVPGKKGNVAYRPRYEYTDASGTLHQAETEWTSSPPAYEVGEAIAVFYAPEAPADHRVGGVVSRYVAPMAFGWTAVGLFFIARACWRSRRAETAEQRRGLRRKFLKALLAGDGDSDPANDTFTIEDARKAA